MRKNLKSLLSDKGFKMTKQRKAILDILSEAETCMSAEEIFLEVKENSPSTCLTTVYRTIELLVSNNLLNKLDFGDNKYRYEINSNYHHHHVVCLNCKKIICLEGCPVQEFESKIGARTDFKITGHRLELYGYCPECQESM